jgi:hypothetical protein
MHVANVSLMHMANVSHEFSFPQFPVQVPGGFFFFGFFGFFFFGFFFFGFGTGPAIADEQCRGSSLAEA